MIQERIEDDILIITLSNGKDNSLTAEFFTRMKEIIKQANENPSPKGIIITGDNKFFSSGFNLPMFLAYKDVSEVAKFFKELEEPTLVDLFTCKKPVIAAINGHAVAGGMIIASACDYRIVANHPKIRIGLSEINIGLPLAIAQGEIVRFSMNNDKNFRDLIFFGQMFDVNQAKAINFIDEIVEADQLIPRAKQLISMWIDKPGRAFIPMKTLLRRELADRMRAWIAESDWNEGLQCFFKEDVRKALQFVMAMLPK